MVDIVGVRFRQAGKIYYFDPSGIDLEVNVHVVVKTTQGLELGRVVIAPTQVEASEVTKNLKSVVRQADPEDMQQAQDMASKEGEALIECEKLVAKLGLPMKMLAAEYNLNGNHLTIFFKAAERVDFRELVREMNSRLRTRVELRQLRPRDEAKLIGGFGRCGHPLCCARFLDEFAPVSIKMAKEQDLPLNPMKISGVCGRLLCCLTYEFEQYRAMKEKLPKKGQRVSTPMGTAYVLGSNSLKETVMVELESQATVELPLSDITIEEETPPKKSGRKE